MVGHTNRLTRQSNNQIPVHCIDYCQTNINNPLQRHLKLDLESMKKYENNISLNISILFWTIITIIILFIIFIIFNLKAN